MPFFLNVSLTYLIRFLLINGAFWISVLGANRSAARTQTCNTTECKTAAELIKKYMDTSVDPCDNFYEFVCNGIMRYDVLNGDDYISTLAETTERIKTQLKANIKLGKEDNDPEAFQKLHSHYKACLDIGEVNSKSTTILSDILKKLGGWPVLVGDSWDDSTFDWKTLTYRLRRLGYADSMNSLISFGMEVDEKNNFRYVITLDDAATGLNNEYLIKGKSNRQITAYYKYMVHTAKRLGANRWFAGFDLAQSLLFEMKLAEISLTTEKRRNRTQLYNPINIDKLEYEYPESGWTEYINSLLWPHHKVTFRDRIIVRNPPYLKALSELISRTPKRVIANYAIWRMVQESVPFMNDRLQELRVDFNALTTGTGVLLSRSEQCIEYVAAHIPIAVGALYVRKVFDKNLKPKVTELVKELIGSFQSTVEQAEWMEKETRARALMKLHVMYKHVAYPEELLDNQKLDEYFADLKATPDSYLDSYLSVNLFDMDDLYRQFRASNDKTEWTAHGFSTLTDASYQHTENSIDIPAGLIQKEVLAIGRPNYMNYGTLGWIIGQNIAHAFDDTGSQYNGEGNLADWWDPETRQIYQNRTECIVEKYSNYTIKGNKINGVNTQGENLADTVGIQQAYYAYEEYEKKKGVEPRLPGLSSYTPRQLFWISAASLWCEKLTPEALKDIVANEKRCPSEIRVIGSFSNMYEFSQDFGCPLRTYMNPELKCVVW